VMTRGWDDADVLGPALLSIIEQDLTALSPFMDYLCASIDLEF
jgi:uncharacterized protein (DUF2461 family)